MFIHSILEKRILIIIAVFLAIAAAIIGFVIVPTVFEIRQIDRDTYNLRLTLERKNHQATSYRIAAKQIDKLKKEMPEFDQYLFYAGEELKLITTLEVLAAKHNVTQRIVNSSLDNITNQRVQISLAVSGSYLKAFQYLDDLERLPYFINVSRVSLTPYSDKENPDITDGVLMNIDFTLYVIP